MGKQNVTDQVRAPHTVKTGASKKTLASTSSSSPKRWFSSFHWGVAICTLSLVLLLWTSGVLNRLFTVSTYDVSTISTRDPIFTAAEPSSFLQAEPVIIGAFFVGTLLAVGSLLYEKWDYIADSFLELAPFGNSRELVKRIEYMSLRLLYSKPSSAEEEVYDKHVKCVKETQLGGEGFIHSSSDQDLPLLKRLDEIISDKNVVDFSSSNAYCGGLERDNIISTAKTLQDQVEAVKTQWFSTSAGYEVIKSVREIFENPADSIKVMEWLGKCIKDSSLVSCSLSELCIGLQNKGVCMNLINYANQLPDVCKKADFLILWEGIGDQMMEDKFHYSSFFTFYPLLTLGCIVFGLISFLTLLLWRFGFLGFEQNSDVIVGASKNKGAVGVESEDEEEDTE